ncbi:spore germination protein [Alteribacillus persepolensis]|uniref:Spore germination protein n=1 Tax=Alteribacillus persepolensis TaxID=568899 RepID=A0A1G8GE77_9BACI|nr:Ger(x)C family spore germination protein [Alteribacillus persepolensis]SDH92683.1 spore germination protein [Alteribacillus persepolensis]
MKKCVLLALFIFLVGCTDQHIVENVGFVQALGLDMTEEQSEFLISAVVPQIEPDAANDREFLTTKSDSDKEAMLSLSRQSNRQIENGQLRNVLFGEETAKNGVLEQINTMNRDPIFGTRVKVSVVRGKAYELLSEPYTQHPQVSEYLDALIEKESRLHMAPETRLHQFTRDLYEKGIDPIAPLIKRGDDKIALDGIALFRGDTYVDKIDPVDARIFFFLHGNFSAGAVHLQLEDDRIEKNVQLLFDSIRNKQDINVMKADNPEDITIDINVHIKGALLEYNGPLDITEDKGLHELEQQLGQSVEKRAQRVIQKLQAKQVDSLGLGRRVKNHLSYQQWNGMDWHKVYPQINVHVHVKADINDIGVYS